MFHEKFELQKLDINLEFEVNISNKSVKFLNIFHGSGLMLVKETLATVQLGCWKMFFVKRQIGSIFGSAG